MKYSLAIFVTLLFFSCSKENPTNPDFYLSKLKQEEFKLSIVRYFEKLPTEKDNHQTKFDSIHNDYYIKKAKKANLLFLYIDKDSTYYFAIAKIAPSLKIKKVATIGKLKIKNDSITYYEEVARTWKMEEDELKTKTAKIFNSFVNGEDLESFYTKNSKNEFYIEFPDDINKYNVEKRKWVTINEK